MKGEGESELVEREAFVAKKSEAFFPVRKSFGNRCGIGQDPVVDEENFCTKLPSMTA